jgi:host factor-I protein
VEESLGLRRNTLRLIKSQDDLGDCFTPILAKGANMEKLTQQNIQEAFLNNARKDKTFLTIYLMSGVKLSGRIKSFDKYSVILEASNQEQLIFKHAISTVVISKSAHSSMSHPGPISPGPAPLVPPPTADTSQE